MGWLLFVIVFVGVAVVAVGAVMTVRRRPPRGLPPGATDPYVRELRGHGLGPMNTGGGGPGSY